MTAERTRYVTGTYKPYFHDQSPLTGYRGTHLADVGQSASASRFCTLIWRVASKRMKAGNGKTGRPISFDTDQP